MDTKTVIMSLFKMTELEMIQLLERHSGILPTLLASRKSFRNLARLVGTTEASIRRWADPEHPVMPKTRAVQLALVRELREEIEEIAIREGLIPDAEKEGKLPSGKTGAGNAQILGPGVPVPILGRVPAGRFVISECVREGYYIMIGTTERAAHCFGLRVAGDSMSPVIPDGTIVLVDSKLEPVNGDIVIARRKTEEDCSCKYYYDHLGPYITLEAENRAYDHMLVPREEFQCIGVVIEYRVKLPRSGGGNTDREGKSGE